MTTQELIAAFANYKEAKDQLECFLDPVVRAIGFHSISDIDITEDKVSIKAEWHGSYQAHDTETFEFPTPLLEYGDGVIISFLNAKQAEAKQEQDAARKAEIEHNEMLEFARLRQKYGP